MDRSYQQLIWDLAEMLWRQEFHPYPPLGSFATIDNVQQEVFLAQAAKLAGQLVERNYFKEYS